MTPQERSAVRAGCNLATLPAAVRAELAEELKRAGERQGTINREAARLFAFRRNRFRVERELAQLGDLGPAVRRRLNKLIEA